MSETPRRLLARTRRQAHRRLTSALAGPALAGIAAAANLIPVRRAVKIDPMVALRYE